MKKQRLCLFDFWAGHLSAMLAVTKWGMEWDCRHAVIMFGVTAMCVGWAIMRTISSKEISP
jgi:hypothetical protein